MPFGLGIGELLIIVLIVLFLFGAKKIPMIARGLGEGIRDFKKEVKDDEDRSLEEGDDDRPR